MTIQYPIGVNDRQLRVLEAGEGSDHLLFIHGLGARADRWKKNLPAFAAKGFHCYAVDLPGHGLSFKSDDFDFSVRSCADLVLSLIDSLQIERIAIVGTSFGGYVGAVLSTIAPKRVKALVLVGTIGIAPLGAEARHQLAERFGSVDRPGIEAKLRTVIHDDKRLVTEALIEEEWRINNSPGAHDAFARITDYIRHNIDDDAVGSQLSRLPDHLPVALIWGSEDKAVPLSVYSASRELIDPDFSALIPKTSHCPYFEASNRFNRLVIDFLRLGS